MADPEIAVLLRAAVRALAGTERPGQLAMAEAVATALSTGRHLLVQAGTGTGKSLGYLVPALVAAHRDRRPVVVATATLALQAQLMEVDLPRLADAVEPLLGRRPSFASLKGRANYACLHRVRDGVPDDDGALVAAADLVRSTGSTSLAAEVLRARDWAEAQALTTGPGDRDRLEPGVSDRAWSHVSVSAAECLSAAKCPYGGECFAERARRAAERVDVVVTNHALLAIDAIEGVPVLPEHAVAVVDEAHELVNRVTAVATDELSPAAVERAARRSRAFAEADDVDTAVGSADLLRSALAGVDAGRLDQLSGPLALAVGAVRDAARRLSSAVGTGSGTDRPVDVEAARRQAKAGLDEVFATADRVVSGSELDVAWIEQRDRTGAVLRIAPLSVSGLLRSRLLDTTTVVMTSATLMLGGSFQALETAVGLRGSEDAYDTLDVGSPFDYRRQAMLYCARHLPAPGREPLGGAVLAELAALVEAAGGRTLGLFSSRRAAQDAAAAVRAALPELPVLCQGEDMLPALLRRFVADPRTSLFGTLSLWQGVDVPGATCSLVVVDRIPFPRPDDPLSSARVRAVARAGGNGFMAVAATHAALLLAQGCGRLVRRSEDRGVVAVLDPRLVTARYGAFLRASLPPMWPTTDRDVVLAALRRLSARPVTPPPVPVSHARVPVPRG